jgi:regulator of protease activity HflC (stomatin/prohibitin superfamily)
VAELLQLLLHVFGYLWPFRVVRQWEGGVWYVWGRYWRTVGPGVWPVIPYFSDILAVSRAPAIYGTPLQTVTLRDKRQLTFSATITVQVEDAAKALNEVEAWHETVVELAAGRLAERLAEADPDRFEPDRKKRQRLLEELRAELDGEAQKWGLRVLGVRFNNFALGLRTYRLLSEPATIRHTPPAAQQQAGQ